MNLSISESRTYLAMCSGTNFKGYRFKKFVLPETDSGISGELEPHILVNDSNTASWYYLNRLDQFSCIDGCIAFEDFLSGIPEMKRFMPQLREARYLLRHIERDISMGQISDIPGDIRDYFDRHPTED